MRIGEEIPIDEHQLRSLMRLKPREQDVAAFFKCSVDTIQRHIKRRWSMTFSEFRDECMIDIKQRLVVTATEKALAGDNVMLIFCLKNLCGWADKPEKEQEDTENKYRTMSTAELIKLVKEKVG